MSRDIPLNWFLYFAAASFAIGLIGVLIRRNAIAVLMAIEIMLNAANINLVAFWRYGTPAPRRRRSLRQPLRLIRFPGVPCARSDDPGSKILNLESQFQI